MPCNAPQLPFLTEASSLLRPIGLSRNLPPWKKDLLSNEHSAIMIPHRCAKYAGVSFASASIGGFPAHETHLYISWSHRPSVRMTCHGSSLVIFLRSPPSTNDTRIFVQYGPLSKCSPNHTAKLADINVVDERGSVLE